jgi:hypothetical protein
MVYLLVKLKSKEIELHIAFNRTWSIHDHFVPCHKGSNCYLPGTATIRYQREDSKKRTGVNGTIQKMFIHCRLPKIQLVSYLKPQPSKKRERVNIHVHVLRARSIASECVCLVSQLQL